MKRANYMINEEVYKKLKDYAAKNSLYLYDAITDILNKTKDRWDDILRNNKPIKNLNKIISVPENKYYKVRKRFNNRAINTIINTYINELQGVKND